jgi:hypothetical protein
MFSASSRRKSDLGFGFTNGHGLDSGNDTVRSGSDYSLSAEFEWATTVTFEEGTQAAWLYEIIKACVTEVIVCDPGRNKLLEDGSKAGQTSPNCAVRSVYHGHEATRKYERLDRLKPLRAV